MDRETEIALLKQIKEGSFFVFERFITEYQTRLFAFIFSLVKNRDDASDLCQETFFKAYKSIRSFKGKSKFSTWLFQIGYFQALNFLKRKKKRVDILKKMDPSIQIDRYSHDLEVKEISQEIDKYMKEIPFNCRTALHLFYKEERNYKEIASIMRIPLNSVKSHIYRGKEEIRNKLSKEAQLNYSIN